MNLHQLRFVREAVRQNYNLTEAAKALYTSQPGVSKAIIELEEELGVDIFTRHGKRIRGLTEPGRAVLRSVELIMQEIDGLKRIGKEFAAQDSGSFTIATTHTQARYALPKVVQAFTQKYPKVRLVFIAGKSKADCRNGTEGPGRPGDRDRGDCQHRRLDLLAMLSMGTCGGRAARASLAQSKPITLEEIAAYPLITYDSAFTGRDKIDHAFAIAS